MKKTFVMIVFALHLISGYSQKDRMFLTYKTDNKFIYDICFTNKGEALGIADNNTIKIYSTNYPKLLAEFKNGHKDRILTINISRDSSLLASGGKDSTIVIWDFIKNKILKSLSYHQGIVTSLKFSPDSRYLLSGGSDNKAILYDIDQDRVVYTFTEHKDIITSVSFSNNQKLIATAGGDKLINIYNLENGALISTLAGHKSWVRSVCFSKDGQKLISFGDDARVIIRDISDLRDIKILTDSKVGFSWILSGDLHQDSRTFAIGNLAGKVIIIGQYYKYKANIGQPVEKILFKPNEGINMKIAIATRGKGVLMINANKMKTANFSER
jgi:WD40 repeat protein